MFEKTLAFFVIGSLATATSLTIKIGPVYSILLGCLAGMSAILLFNYLQGDYSKKPGSKEYRYKFQQHPFDDFHFFSIVASTQKEANLEAQRFFTGLVVENKTVMRIFYIAA